MYNIGVIGHGAGQVHVEEEISNSKIDNVVELLQFQYGKDLVLNVDGEIGMGHAIIKKAKSLGVRYHMFLPAPLEMVGLAWWETQKTRLDSYFKSSYSTTISSSKMTPQSVIMRDKNLVDSSSFVVCFWEGCRQGRVFDVIKYALATNKLVLNGLDDLKMISNMDLKKRSKQII